MKDMRNFFVLELFVLICLVMSASVLSAGEMYHVEKSTIVEKDLVLIGGHSCLLEGTVRGDAVIISGNLELYGNVEGDAVVLGGEVNVYDGSHVNGDMVVISGKMTREKGSIVDGDVVTVNIAPLKYIFKLIPSVTQFSTEEGEVKIEQENIKRPVISGIKHPYKGNIGSGLSAWAPFAQGIALLIIVMIFTAVFPTGSQTMTLYLEKKPGRSFFAGFLSQILFIPAILFLVLSVLGIPLIPFFLLAYPIALLIALVPPSLFIGKRITRDSSFFQERSYLMSFVGLLMLLVLIVIGQLLQIGDSVLQGIGLALSLLALFIFYLYFTFGLGCLILSRLGTRKP